jgi:hypothetical protein
MSSHAWTWRQAFAESDLGSTTKAVLHALSLHMSPTGDSCFPSIVRLMKLTSLSRQTVCEHLDVAETAGWIVRTKHGFAGQRWKRNEYVPRWPNRNENEALAGEPFNSEEKAVKEVDHLFSEGGLPPDRRRSTSRQKAVKEVDSNSSVNSPVTCPEDSSLRSESSAGFSFADAHENPRPSAEQSVVMIEAEESPIDQQANIPAPADEAAEAVRRWNALAEEFGLARVQKLTAARQTKLKKRLADCGGLDGWDAALAHVRVSDGLRGDNDRGWTVDFDFLMQESSFVKLMEGKYDEWGSDNRRSREHAARKDEGAGGILAVARQVKAELARRA